MNDVSKQSEDSRFPVKILFFATLRDQIGQRTIIKEIAPGITVTELKQNLSKQFPAAAPLINTCLVAINHEFAEASMVIPPSAEIAFFPPVSGGARPDKNQFPTIVQVTTEQLDLDGLLAMITLPTTGAACIFSGMVRGETRRGREFTTKYLEYEAYHPMAEAKMHQVAVEIRARWPEVEGIVIVQRIGVLKPGTPTVLIACSAGHRDTGVFEAARYGIDRLKQIVPIWKKEVGPQGESWVEGEYYPEAGE